MDRPVRKRVVVSAVNIRKGGTLTVLKECLEYLSGRKDLEVIALVHKQALCDYPGIRYIEMPWTLKSWFHRLWCEYVTMHKVSKDLGDIDLWLSLHDTSPWVEAKAQAVYCHNPYPFFEWKFRHLFQNRKIVAFSLFSRWIYRVVLKREKWVIVQQEWLRDKFLKMFPFLSLSNVVVALPKSLHPEIPDLRVPGEGKKRFIYAAYGDVHKNFECLCRAAELLENEGFGGTFCVDMTIGPEDNLYCKWLYKKWGHIPSLNFTGFMPREELYRHYGEADCLVFPSQVETWGLPVSEFGVSGKPMLLSDRPYAHETSRGCSRTAFFDPDDPKALAHMMRRIIEGDVTVVKPNPVQPIKEPKAESWADLFKILLSSGEKDDNPKDIS